MWRWVLALVASSALAVGTGYKLHKMALITGWWPGAEVTVEHITKKGTDRGSRGRKDCWVSWASDGLVSRANQDTVSPEIWARMREGDPVEVVHIPGDETGYLKNGVYVEEGQFTFDFVLLALELGVALASTGRLLWWLVRGCRVPFFR